VKSGLSGQNRLTIVEQHVMADAGSEHIVDFLQPGKLGFKIAYSPLEAAYF
jgi:hypothetical protein